MARERRREVCPDCGQHEESAAARGMRGAAIVAAAAIAALALAALAGCAPDEPRYEDEVPVVTARDLCFMRERKLQETLAWCTGKLGATPEESDEFCAVENDDFACSPRSVAECALELAEPWACDERFGERRLRCEGRCWAEEIDAEPR